MITGFLSLTKKKKTRETELNAILTESIKLAVMHLELDGLSDKLDAKFP